MKRPVTDRDRRPRVRPRGRETWVACALLSAACVSIQVVPDSAAPPENFLCRYFLNPYFLRAGELRLGDGEPAFAKVKNAAEAGTELILPFGSADQGAQTTFTSGWITFQARYVPTGGLEVRVTKPTPMSPVLTWNPGDPVVWRGSNEQGRMSVEAKAPDRFKPKAPLHAALPCEFTTIGFPQSEEEAGPEPARLIDLWGEGPVPVSAAPGAAAEGDLSLIKDSNEADWLEERGTWVRVKLDLYPGTLLGWVPKSRTRAAPDRGGLGGIFGGLGGLAAGSKGRGTPRYARCTDLAELHLARPGKPLVKVATLAKHAAVVLGARREGYVEVTLPEDDWIKLEPNVAWALTDAELSRCALSPND